MTQVDQNINKDMVDSDLIDLDLLDFSDNQTWLCKASGDSGENVDVVDWTLSIEWPYVDTKEYIKKEAEFNSMLDKLLLKSLSSPDRQKFDTGTYVKPKKQVKRPSLQTMVEGINASSNPPSITVNPAPSNQSPNKYLTYNKYNNPLSSVSPMVRLKTFNVDTNSDNSAAVKNYAAKRRSVHQYDDDPQLEDAEGESQQAPPSRPIDIDLSQPAHNLHNTFNKGLSNVMNMRGSLTMYQSGESLMRMSPPSLVSSLLMDGSGNFNTDSMEARKSITASLKDSGIAATGRESIDPMMTSMTLSILDEKDMNTSFLSQTTFPDNESLLDSLPPSLVSSVNSSFAVPNASKNKDSLDHNVFSSATFTHLEQSEKLLMSRPRCHPPAYNSFRRDSGLKSSESYIKVKEEPNPNDTLKILNENSDNKESPKTNQMSETVTIHYSNNKFKSKISEKENLNSSFEKSDAFYREMGLQKEPEVSKNSLNVTMGKQELNEIMQARQKLSLARKALPGESAPFNPPNQVTNNATIILPDQIVTVPKQSMENASELLSRRRMALERTDEAREMPIRHPTFRKPTAKATAMDATVVYDNKEMIDINSATFNLIGSGDRTLRKEDCGEWGAQSRAMGGSSSSSSTDTATFSSSSPPEIQNHVISTPLSVIKKSTRDGLLDIHHTISPIYDTAVEDKSYTVVRNGRDGAHNQTVINTNTIVKRSSNVKRDILSAQLNAERKLSPPQAKSTNRLSPTYTASQDTVGAGLAGAPSRRSALPTSKLRQYSSHKELNRIQPNTLAVTKCSLPARGALRRPVYASNPALSPTAQHPPIRRDSYTLATEDASSRSKPAPRPALVRQGTETLRRERPQSQLVQPKDLRGGVGPTVTTIPASMRIHSIPQAPPRPVSTVFSRPTSVPSKPLPAGAMGAGVPAGERPASSGEARTSGLPRPSRLPTQRRTLRPPSVYSVAPTADIDHY